MTDQSLTPTQNPDQSFAYLDDIVASSLSSTTSTLTNSTTSETTQIECGVCKTHFQPTQDTYHDMPLAFHLTCDECWVTCTTCGQNRGWVKRMFTNNRCSYCEKETCMSCSVNLECKKCDITVCVDCFDTEKICSYIKIQHRWKYLWKRNTQWQMKKEMYY